jgi:hypothetical protein
MLTTDNSVLALPATTTPDPESPLVAPAWFENHIRSGGTMASALNEWRMALATMRKQITSSTEADADRHLEYVRSTGLAIDWDRYWRQHEQALAYRAQVLANIEQGERNLAAATAQHIAQQAAERAKAQRQAAEQAGRDQRSLAAEAEAHRLKRAGEIALEAGRWWDHLEWVRLRFDRSFATHEVCEAGMDDPGFVPPPGFPAFPSREDAANRLGRFYRKIARKDFDGLRIEPQPLSHGVRRWRVVCIDGGFTGPL